MAVVNPDFAVGLGEGGGVELPSGVVFSTMGVDREGSDLLIHTADGEEIRVEGYFDQQPPPDLVGGNGQHIAGNVAVVLAGQAASGLVPEMISVEPIGMIHTMSGNVFVVRADGARVQALVDMPLFQGDVLETLDDGAIGVVLADETSFAMSGEGVMVLDELVYDPAEQEGSLSMFLLRGMVTVTSGMISKTDPDGMVIDTPVGTVGIRGTQIGIDATHGETISIIMMEEADGYVGEVTFTNPAGILVLNQAYQVIGVTAGRAPVFLPALSVDDVTATFSHNLAHLPMVNDAANDYSVQKPEGGGELDTAPDSDLAPVPAPEEEADAPADTGNRMIPVMAEELAKPLQPTAPVAPETQAGQVEPAPVVGVAPVPPPPPRPEAVPPAPEQGTPDYGVGLNYPPIAFPDTVNVKEDQTLSGQLLATDADQDALTFALAEDGAPAHGAVELNPDGTYIYTPAPDFSGVDEFTFSVSDGQGGVTQSTVSVQVEPVAATPVLDVSDISVIADSEPGIVIKGTKQDDELVGTTGDDQISGKGGDDIILGDSGLIGVIPAIPLDIQVRLEEGEDMGNLDISLQGVPEGATLSAGTDEGGGVWSLTPDDLTGLSLSLPETHQGDFSLVVDATHTDTNPDLEMSDTASNSAVINVSVAVPGGDDTIKGNAGDDIIDGGGGDDAIWGGSGDDVLHGGVGDDDIRGDAGMDVIYGGAGDDDLSGGAGEDVLHGGIGDDAIRGDAGEDFLYGDEGNDDLSGNAGDDVLHGGAGHDVLAGDQGDDVLYGDAGNDEIDGGAGDDVIVGGAGDDILHGGKGFDQFIFGLDAGSDIIGDYKPGEQIHFEGPEFSATEPQITGNDNGGVSIMFDDHNVEVTVDNVDLSQQGYTITPSDDGVTIVFDDDLKS